MLMGEGLRANYGRSKVVAPTAAYAIVGNIAKQPAGLLTRSERGTSLWQKRARARPACIP
jgi:hypothetical protein